MSRRRRSWDHEWMPWQIRNQLMDLRNAEQSEWNDHLSRSQPSKDAVFGSFNLHDKATCLTCTAYGNRVIAYEDAIRVFGGRIRR